MKKVLKELTLDKEVISNLDLNKVEGGGTCFCGGGGGITDGALGTCPPPGMMCFQNNIIIHRICIVKNGFTK